jgi:hypothetical protein
VLRKLISNNVYPFIFASHMGIWAQPNNAGANKRFHWAMEKSAKRMRSGEDQATLEYFNHILNKGWVYFLEAERSTKSSSRQYYLLSTTTRRKGCKKI